LQASDENLVFRQYVRRDTGCCTYLFGATPHGDYVIVDPLMDFERFLPPSGGRESHIRYVFDTHIHADHLSGARELCFLTGAKLLMYESSPVSFEFEPIGDGMNLNLCGLNVKVLNTPGHASEHVSLLVDNRFLLSGDSLLIGDVARTDLGRGSNEQLYQTLFEKLFLLEDRIEVYPAHIGAKHSLSDKQSSTMGIEKHLNPALQLKNFHEFVQYMTEGWPPKPSNYELYIKVNQKQIKLEEAQRLVQDVALGEA
jgi:glyoxylase-like metal-dependent hydrolase (beta-lactamase superfamily II)